jgi:diguanylate cyclase (GGDEF)-like protein
MDPLQPVDLSREDSRHVAEAGASHAPACRFQPGRLTLDQLRAMRELWPAVADASGASPVQVLASLVAEIIDAPVGVAALDVASERLDVEAASGPEPESAAAAREMMEATRRIDSSGRSLTVVLGPEGDGQSWTVVPLRSHQSRTRILMLPGDWSRWPSLDWLDRLGRDLTSAMRLPDTRTRSRRRIRLLTRARAFARTLARTTEPAAIHRAILDAFARATHAEQAALALFDEDDGHLWIAATHGYPHVLVEHVRIAPGSGVIGQVFKSRVPLRVADVARLGPLYLHRPRYRTPSFIALPLTLADDPLGVVTLADRADGRAFDRADLVAASTLASASALALARQQVARQAQDLEHAVAIEPLTGLFNRRHFSMRIGEEVERARRYSLDLALLLVDIDNFKRLNDSCGHLVGDQVLRDTASILRESVRVFDVCTRFGGDEFAILMPGSTATSALQSADRIRQRVEAYRPAGGAAIFDERITISVGVTARGPSTTTDEMIAAADRALYTAKAEGKNRVTLLE